MARTQVGRSSRLTELGICRKLCISHGMAATGYRMKSSHRNHACTTVARTVGSLCPVFLTLGGAKTGTVAPLAGQG